MDNPSMMFVTLFAGLLSTRHRGEVVLCSGGHPAPWLRRASGQVENVVLPPGRLLGLCRAGQVAWQDAHLTMAPEDTLKLPSRMAFPGARHPGTRGDVRGTQDGARSWRVSQLRCRWPNVPTEHVAAAEEFTAAKDLQDDGTILAAAA